jgi:hypothetical protein
MISACGSCACYRPKLMAEAHRTLAAMLAWKQKGGDAWWRLSDAEKDQMIVPLLDQITDVGKNRAPPPGTEKTGCTAKKEPPHSRPKVPAGLSRQGGVRT